VALLESESISLAAEKAGMTRQHVHKLLRDTAFVKALRAARSTAHGHAMSRLCALSSKAVTVLGEALDGKDIPKGRFLAARAVLELAGRAIEIDVEDRLVAIEAELERTANATYTT
jgi:hypothetical protein